MEISLRMRYIASLLGGNLFFAKPLAAFFFDNLYTNYDVRLIFKRNLSYYGRVGLILQSQKK